MNSVNIPIELLSRSPRAYVGSAKKASAQQTRFADLPLPARLLLAVPRVRGPLPKAHLAERYVLDTIGRVIDAGPQRRQTIEAVNLLSEILLTPTLLDETVEKTDPQWLSAMENMVLCVLCKVRNGQTQEAKQLTQHWLNKTSIQNFSVAAEALCQSACFKQSGPHVFTPSWTSTAVPNPESRCRSATFVKELSLGELLLLNAFRLRMRTLAYSGINKRVLPLLSEHLAIPKIETIVDAHLKEALQYSSQTIDIRCLCSKDISADEAQLLASMAAFATGDNTEIASQLSAWLPTPSVNRLQDRGAEFQTIVQQLGAVIPRRDWNMAELAERRHLRRDCQHVTEPRMFH